MSAISSPAKIEVQSQVDSLLNTAAPVVEKVTQLVEGTQSQSPVLKVNVDLSKLDSN